MKNRIDKVGSPKTWSVVCPTCEKELLHFNSKDSFHGSDNFSCNCSSITFPPKYFLDLDVNNKEYNLSKETMVIM